MSFLNKFKKEFEGLNLSDRLGQQQGGAPPTPDTHGSNSYQNQYQGQQPPYSPPQQSYNPGQPQQNPGFQAYTGPPHNGHSSFSGQPYHPPTQQQYPGHQAPSPQPPPAYNSSPQIQQQPQHQPWSPPPASMASPPSINPIHSPAAPVTPYGAPPPSALPCPTPPRWIPHWSEKDQQWYYVETSGRSSWQAPSELPPLSGMPAFPGSLNAINRAPGGQSLTHPPQPQYANPQDSRPTLPEGDKKSSSLLAAAGGFTVGGVAGYFVKDRIDKRKAKKRHGRNAEDFADFVEYPARAVDLYCDICDQWISGPYAHCKKCDGGDYDICRDCLAQGQTCKGKGKHSLVKVYPKYFCDTCNVLIKGSRKSRTLRPPVRTRAHVHSTQMAANAANNNAREPRRPSPRTGWEPDCTGPIPTCIPSFERLPADSRKLGNDHIRPYFSFENLVHIALEWFRLLKSLGAVHKHEVNYRFMWSYNTTVRNIATREQAVSWVQSQRESFKARAVKEGLEHGEWVQPVMGFRLYMECVKPFVNDDGTLKTVEGVLDGVELEEIMNSCVPELCLSILA
ncbi:hypothetical protein FAUST_6647 [Fusarium austroamericanum]|uniref:WW domain-containing protein n=1 Tax=Fusarium austroamericanum TaxID=282268 RepID=A0AAN5Z818_FUSAU|nr:hypothetical protein FAUST_6647 [Fusarium austroamericanum]